MLGIFGCFKRVKSFRIDFGDFLDAGGQARLYAISREGNIARTVPDVGRDLDK
jgi:hypothetical protein